MLYHFTSLVNLDSILDAREIRPSKGPDGKQYAGQHRSSPLSVVWLIDDWDPGVGSDHGLGVPGKDDPRTDKRGVRITVTVSDAQHWPEWAQHRKVHRKELRDLDSAGGGLSERWWIVPRAIGTSDWALVENRFTDEVLWPIAPSRLPIPQLH
jgi:hypothetical protein